MQRIAVTERPDLRRAAEEHGLEYSASKGITGWDESAYYQFTSRQIEENLVGPAEEIEGLCFEVVDRAVNSESVLDRLGIGEHFWDYIADSWRNGEKNLYGRMDLSYDGDGPANCWSTTRTRQRCFMKRRCFNGNGWNKRRKVSSFPKAAIN